MITMFLDISHFGTSMVKRWVWTTLFSLISRQVPLKVRGAPSNALAMLTWPPEILTCQYLPRQGGSISSVWSRQYKFSQIHWRCDSLQHPNILLCCYSALNALVFVYYFTHMLVNILHICLFMPECNILIHTKGSLRFIHITEKL